MGVEVSSVTSPLSPRCSQWRTAPVTNNKLVLREPNLYTLLACSAVASPRAPTKGKSGEDGEWAAEASEVLP